ncbi:Cytochrome b-c1 complex subunit 9 [Plasmodiophora brassicae]
MRRAAAMVMMRAGPSVRVGARRYASGSAVLEGVYNRFMKSNVAYVTSIIMVGVIVEQLYDRGFDSLWKYHNRGKLFEDMIHHAVVEQPEEEEEEDVEEHQQDEDAGAAAADGQEDE